MSSRVSSRVRVLLAACVLLVSGEAAALPSVDLLFTELNGQSIAATDFLAVSPGDQIGVEMHMTTDERGVFAYSISVDFDSAENERVALDSFANLFPFPFAAPLAPQPLGPRTLWAMRVPRSPDSSGTSRRPFNW